MTSKHFLTLAALVAASATSSAQSYQPSYVDWGIRGAQFPEALDKWQRGTKWCDDDNFFISRVKPKARFRNQATQINPDLNEKNDKKLIFWVPINNATGNSLPDSKFDSEVFPFWQYVTHYGNWSCTLGRLPGNFADVAHKNGVPVSTVVTVPYGPISNNEAWRQALITFGATDVDKFSDYLEYYGQDGFGYNSEFQCQASLIDGLNNMHDALVKRAKAKDPNTAFEIIWYDGTKNDGTIMFDRGLVSGNIPIWGVGDDIRTSLFFNYNWNMGTILPSSVTRAEMEGRSPLDLYAGINMQGREPSNYKDKIWTYLKDYPISIGLWGAHSENMFYEGRGEHGTEQSVAQRSYMLRMEKWFTGGTRNPLTAPEINNSLQCTADNDGFFGMSKMMTARSSLKWDLSEEPFISYFNLGNGRFFNWDGERANNNSWYNIGIQDHLPTWRWWFAGSFLGNTEADRPTGSLDAEFVWDEAWMGGSLVRIFGSSANSYLHLFKTEFGLKRGDVITVRYKVLAGASDINLSLGMKGSEKTAANEDRLVVAKKDDIVAGQWIEKKFTIDEDMAALADKDLAVVALHFANAEGFDMRLGEFSIIRPGATSVRPETPVIEKAEMLAASKAGADAKLIFNMPNNKPADKVCYNSDVNTSMFRLWFKQEGREPILMGATTSWAALFYSLPVDVSGDMKTLKIGVSALSMDMTTESDIAWSEPLDITDIYKMSDDIKITHTSVQPGEPFILLYADNCHEPGTWEILDDKDNVVLKAENATVLSANSGIKTPGTYSLRLTGYVAGENGREVTTREFRPLLQVVETEFGSKPRLFGMYSGDKEYAQVEVGETVPVEYLGSKSEGSVSNGVKISDNGFGFNFAETSIFDKDDSYAVAMWFKPLGFEDNSVHMLNIRNKADKWPNNAWGYSWQVAGENGSFGTLNVKDHNNTVYAYTYADTFLNPGIWYHIIYSFRYDDKGRLYPEVFINGKLIKPSSWTIGGVAQEGDVKPIERPKSLLEEAVAIGGYLHKTGTVRCVIDNFAVWKKDNFGEEDAKVAMGKVDTENLPDGLIGYFDFEDEADADGKFINKGKENFPAFIQVYFSTENEGQGLQSVAKASIAPGSPYAEGRAFNVNTNVEWTAVGGKIEDIKGDCKSGSANVTFSAPGRYDVKVRLSNAYGEDTRSLPVYVGGVSINDTFAPAAKEVNLVNNPFGETLELSFGVAGRYALRLFDMSGALVYSADYEAAGGENGVFRPGVGSGVYLLHVEGPDGYTATFKAVR